MNRFISILFIILSVAVGATFLYSAYTKLFPIQPFEYTMVEFVHFPWIVATIAARFLVGLEAGLGALIVLHLYGKNKWVLKTAFGVLIFFSIYLVWLWVTAGNNVNCGCFGDAIWMSPSASLTKNAILLILIGLLIRYHNGFNKKWFHIASPVLLLIVIVQPFIILTIPHEQPSWLRTDRYKIDLSALYQTSNDSTSGNLHRIYSSEYPAPNLLPDLEKGKYIIAFLSQSCPHCRIAAYKMHVMKQNNPSLPFFMVIGGTTSDLTDFWKATKAQNIPYTRLDKNHFLQYTGGVFPLIIWVNDGTVEAKADYNTLTQSAIEKWLK